MGVQGLLRAVWCRIVGVEEREVAGLRRRHRVAYLAVQLREERARRERAEKDRDLAFGILRDVLQALHADPHLGPALRGGGWLGECWRTLEAAERRCWGRGGEGGGGDAANADEGNGDGVEAPPW